MKKLLLCCKVLEDAADFLDLGHRSTRLKTADYVFVDCGFAGDDCSYDDDYYYGRVGC